MVWKLSNRQKKSVVQIETYERDGETIQLETGWRWGTFKYSTKPDVNLEQIGSSEAYELGEVIDHDLDDGCWLDWTFPEHMSDLEKEEIENAYEEEGDYGLEQQGWSNTDTEYFLNGPLDLEFHPDNYVKKPVVVQAVQFTEDNIEGLRSFCGNALGIVENGEAHIRTLEDGKDNQVQHIATLGDYIIKGVRGEFYPCKPDIFEETYETTWRSYETQE